MIRQPTAPPAAIIPAAIQLARLEADRFPKEMTKPITRVATVAATASSRSGCQYPGWRYGGAVICSFYPFSAGAALALAWPGAAADQTLLAFHVEALQDLFGVFDLVDVQDVLVVDQAQ